MKKLVLFLVAALFITGIVATRLWVQLRDNREQLAVLQARVKAIEPAAPPARPGTTPSPPIGASVMSPSPSPQRPARTKEPGMLADLLLRTMQPETRDMRRAALQRMMPLQYPDIGKVLHLSPEEVNKLFELLATQQVNGLELTMKMATSRQDPAAFQEAQQALSGIQQKNSGEQTAMLGGKYPQWQEYQQSLRTRREVGELQLVLGSGANALSEAQSDALIASVSAERDRMSKERSSSRDAEGRPPDAAREGTAEGNQRILDVASAHLNPQQLEAYQRMVNQRGG